MHNLWPVPLLPPCVFSCTVGVCWCIINVPPTLGDREPTVVMTSPAWLDRRHVWIYLSVLEFISSSLSLCFCWTTSVPSFPSFIRNCSELLGGLWELWGWSGPLLLSSETEPASASSGASWHGLVWMCVLNPTQCCLRRLRVKVVSQLFCINRAVLLAGFLWRWCCRDYISNCSVLLIRWLLS